MDNFRKRYKKDINWGFIKRVFLCFILGFGYLSIIYAASTIAGSDIFSTKRYVTVLLCLIPVSFLYACLVERLGTSLTDLALAWTHRKTDLSEQFSADMAKARFSKGKGEFRDALLLVSKILEKYPDFPEALLLKAQILWEGYDNKELALRNLDKVMSMVKDDAPIHRWAMNYYHEVIKGRKPRN